MMRVFFHLGLWTNRGTEAQIRVVAGAEERTQGPCPSLPRLQQRPSPITHSSAEGHGGLFSARTLDLAPIHAAIWTDGRMCVPRSSSRRLGCWDSGKTAQDPLGPPGHSHLRRRLLHGDSPMLFSGERTPEDRMWTDPIFGFKRSHKKKEIS